MHRPACLLVISGLAGAAAAGCGARSQLELGPKCHDEGSTRPCESVCGPGLEICLGGRWRSCSAPMPADQLPLEGTIRDFRGAHPDFETTIGDDPGIVEADLGADDKPVYAGSPVTLTTSGQESFDQWYNDAQGVNLSASHTIVLARAAGHQTLYQLNEPAFFPIDGQLLGNEGREHNFHFTYEVHSEFRYTGGEVFTFTGDDDLWVFINRRLAIDLGGIHAARSRTVSLDDSADYLGLERGEIYPLSLFFAERHTDLSSFRIDTTIAEFKICP